MAAARAVRSRPACMTVWSGLTSAATQWLFESQAPSSEAGPTSMTVEAPAVLEHRVRAQLPRGRSAEPRTMHVRRAGQRRGLAVEDAVTQPRDQVQTRCHQAPEGVTGPAAPGHRGADELCQLYLAGIRTARQLVAEADLEPRERTRVQFSLENVAEALAPSNVPLVNPGSAKVVIDTAGLSLVRGGKQLAQDMATAPRVPATVDGSGFTLGDNIAATPGAVVLRTEVLELIQ